MQFQAYLDGALSTAVYPRKYAMIYPALKLTGEIGELIESIQASEDEDECVDISEMSDVLWYIFVTARDCAVEVDDLVAGCDNFEHMRNRLVVENPNPLITLVTGAALVNEAVGKSLRDDNGVLTDAKRNRIRNGLGMCLESIDAVASQNNLNLVDVAEFNLKKLASRMDRGVIKGSGGDR